jgi:hypothetical protein
MQESWVPAQVQERNKEGWKEGKSGRGIKRGKKRRREGEREGGRKIKTFALVITMAETS